MDAVIVNIREVAEPLYGESEIQVERILRSKLPFVASREVIRADGVGLAAGSEDRREYRVGVIAAPENPGK